MPSSPASLPPHILLIEDNDAVRNVLTRQLEILGVQVCALPSGDGVKRELDRAHYDLVIADLHLPDCSGTDIARFARAKQCQVILLSGDHDATRNPSVLSAGFDEIIVKPLTLDKLRSILESRGLLLPTEPSSTPEPTDMGFDTRHVIDPVGLREYMGDLDEIALAMLARFPDMIRPLVDKIDNFSKAQDWPHVAEMAHSLKGAARSIAATRLGDICESIQNDAEKGVFTPDSIDILISEFQAVEAEIQSFSADF